MRRIVTGLVALVGLVACSGDADDDVASATSTSRVSSTTVEEELGPPYLGDLTFDWPTDCSVPVSERVEVKGQRFELAYDVVLTTVGANTELELDEMRVVSFRGERPPTAMAEEMAAPFALPRLVFDQSGVVVEVRGLEELFDEMAAVDPSLDLRDMPPALREQYGQALIDKYWGTWAEPWAAVLTLVEPEETVELELPLGDQVVPQTLTMTSVGTTTSGDVVLKATSTLGRDGLRVAMQSMMETLAANATPEELASFDGERVTTRDVTTDPRTLRPRTASVEIASDITIGDEERSEVERREWTFDWQDSTC